jgi:hypothetical protein
MVQVSETGLVLLKMACYKATLAVLAHSLASFLTMGALTHELTPYNTIPHVVTQAGGPCQSLALGCLDFPATRLISQIYLFSHILSSIKYYVTATQNRLTQVTTNVKTPR